MVPPGQTTEVPLIWKLRRTSGHFRVHIPWLNRGEKQVWGGEWFCVGWADWFWLLRGKYRCCCTVGTGRRASLDPMKSSGVLSNSMVGGKSSWKRTATQNEQGNCRPSFLLNEARIIPPGQNLWPHEGLAEGRENTGQTTEEGGYKCLTACDKNGNYSTSVLFPY